MERGGDRGSLVELPRKSLRVHAYKYVGVKRSSETAPTRRVSRWSAVVMAAAAVAQGGGERGVAPAKEDTKLPLSSFSAWVVWRVRWPQRRWACLPRVGGAVLERRGGVVG